MEGSLKRLLDKSENLFCNVELEILVVFDVVVLVVWVLPLESVVFLIVVWVPSGLFITDTYSLLILFCWLPLFFYVDGVFVLFSIVVVVAGELF